MSPARPDAAPAVKPIEVSAELKALMRRLKLGQLLDKLPEFHEMEKAAGRTLPITAFGAEHDPAMWLAYRDAGIERIVLSIDSAAADVILPKLDGWAASIATVA